MRTTLQERFPEAVTVQAERFGDGDVVDGVCAKCSHEIEDPMWHIPVELGGGCLPQDGDTDTCPFCGELAGYCKSWCEYARSAR